MSDSDPSAPVSHFVCSQCHTRLEADEVLCFEGAQMQCPLCGHPWQVMAARPSTPEASSLSHAATQRTPGSPTAQPGGDTGHSLKAVTPAPLSFGPVGPLPEVPGYTILGELGRGGMGVVYKARHEKLKRIVALKMVRGGSEIDAQERSRFTAEAEAVARLHHPGIVQIFEIGEHEGQDYLALEFVSGGNLRMRLLGKPQPVRAAVQLIERLARAVQAAHLRGIVHRDLKPANILLAPPSTDERDENSQSEAAQLYGTPKITDFGLAKRLDQDSGPTVPGEVVGTPLYMAPEQAEGRTEEVGPPTDVYALGAILYEMLTGQPPFESLAFNDVLTRMATDTPPPPRSLRRGLSRDLEAICLKCLARDPRQRYPGAGALADDLRRFLNGEPVRARPPGIAARLWRWCLRNPTPASLLLTVSLVLGFGLWHLSRLSEDLMHARAEKDAMQQTQLLRETMKYYSENVVRWAKKGGLDPTANFRTDKGGIPFPFAFTIELSDQFKRNAEIATEVRVYSDHPFRFRGPPVMDEWEKRALTELREDPSQPVKTFTTYKTIPSLRYATSIRMQATCVKCHNSHEDSTKTDWKEGDVRGVIEIIRPLAGDMEDTSKKLRGTYLLLGGTAAALLALFGMILAIGRRQRR